MQKPTKSATISVRVAPEIKEKASEIYKKQYGLTLTDAVNMFLHQTVNAGGIPFVAKAEEKGASTPDQN